MTEKTNLAEQAASIANVAQDLSNEAARLALDVSQVGGGTIHSDNFLTMGLTVFVLACFVGYYVVWHVTPALHAPLMAMTNAISSVIIVGALLAAGLAGFSFAKFLGFLAVILACVNIFGGFIVTRRMLAMFKGKGN